ncbi:MAG: DUF3046 domain-containing protein [Bifidobacteriaceae bacterium]|nr:DUF3046 domain-containing protein [Bifidobacteriaceae bacterium]
MRISQFWQAMDTVFGVGYSRSLASDLVIASLGQRTAGQALADGLAPRLVWQAVCDAMEVSDEQRWPFRAEPQRRPVNRGY